jgi:hypothetical protein
MKIAIKQVSLDSSALKLGPPPDHSRFDNKEGGPTHVALLGDHLVAIWDDRDEEAVLLPWHRMKEIRLRKSDLLAALATQAATSPPVDLAERRRASGDR